MVSRFTISPSVLSIVLALSKGSCHVRKLASLCSISHVAVLKNLALLESAGVVSYEFRGRNKEYSLTSSENARIYLNIAKEFVKLK